MKNKKLINFRNQIGLTQKEMADKLGISEIYYLKIEHGDRNTSFNFIKKFKKEFPNENIDELFFKKIY